MTFHETPEHDHFAAIRGELLVATRRHLQRAQRRRHLALVTTIVILGLVVLTGIAAATNERVGDAVRIVHGSVSDVFIGEPEITEPPTERSREMLHDMEALMRGMDPESPDGDSKFDVEPRVLLREEVDGVDVEIVAIDRPKGSPSAFGPTRKRETCYSIATDDPFGGGGGVTCTPAFNPGLPINYSAQSSGRCGRSWVTLSGIAAEPVTAVRFELPNGIERATFAGGAFWWRGDTAPTTVHVDLVDGSTVSRPYAYDDGNVPAPPRISPARRAICEAAMAVRMNTLPRR